MSTTLIHSNPITLTRVGYDASTRTAVKTIQLPAASPVDIALEISLLSAPSSHHPNIIKLLSYFYDDRNQVHLTFPYHPFTLHQLINSARFQPTALVPPTDSSISSYSQLVHSLSWQMIESIRFLHSINIAHRDISINNFLITSSARIVLIDFDLAIEHVPDGDAKDSSHLEDSGIGEAMMEEDSADRMRSGTGKLHYQVGTGHYRAPELLFGSTSYDPFALDLWSLGVVLSSFFTPLVPARLRNYTLASGSSNHSVASLYSVSRTGTLEREDEKMRDLEGGLEAVALTPSASSGEVALSGNGGRGQRKGGDLIRESIFKGEFGEFALIGSIFRCLGTPTVQTWPEAASLPDFSRFAFVNFPPTPLRLYLPHITLLPHVSPMEEIIANLLLCSASKRIRAAEALLLGGWQEVGLSLPAEMDAGSMRTGGNDLRMLLKDALGDEWIPDYP